MSKTKIPVKLRHEILKRDNHSCLWCGRTPADGIKLEIDHIFPESMGGKTSYENLGTLCNHCNNAKSNEFCGNYLLMTHIKIPQFDEKIELIEVGNIDSKGNHFDGRVYKYSLGFFKRPCPDYSYEKTTLSHEFVIGNMLSICDTDDCIIRKDLIKNEALLKFKDKIRDFLCENNGYLNDLNGRIIFVERNSPLV